MRWFNKWPEKKEIAGVTLELKSFPVMENYYEGSDTRNKINDLLEKAQQGGTEDVFSFVTTIFGLSRSIYLYDTPAAILTRQNSFKVLWQMAKEGHEGSMYNAAIMLITGEGTRQHIGLAKETLEKLSQSTATPDNKKLADDALEKLYKAIEENNLPKPTTYTEYTPGEGKVSEYREETVATAKDEIQDSALKRDIKVPKPLIPKQAP